MISFIKNLSQAFKCVDRVGFAVIASVCCNSSISVQPACVLYHKLAMCKLCVHGIQSIERARCIAFAHVSNCVLTGSKSTIEKHSGQGTKVSRYITSDPNVPYTVQQTLACAPFYRCCRAGSNQCHICRRSACKTVSPSAMHK